MKIKQREEIKDILAYEPGKPVEDVKREYGIDNVIKLASNENPFGCSPKAKEAIKQAVDNLAIYPDGNSTILRETISKKFNIPFECVLPSCGSDEMIDIISRAYLSHGDEVIMADITFPRYITATKIMGATPVVVPLKDFKYDLASMKDKINSKTKLIWLCNPNNPTGTIFTDSELESFLEGIDESVLVVYDEAYNEYADHENYPRNSVDLVKNNSNIVVLRTFSKAYGLAALRVGYTMASSEIIDALNRVRGPFNVNLLAQEAAVAALNDDEFLNESINKNLEGKKFLYNEFDKLSVKYVKSYANHIFLDSGFPAGEVFENMQKLGVIIRPMGGTYIRVTIGSEEENRAFIDCFKKVTNR
ncbi:MAG: histidinol-phosphate transaminase [Clostridium sp.]